MLLWRGESEVFPARSHETSVSSVAWGWLFESWIITSFVSVHAVEGYAMLVHRSFD